MKFICMIILLVIILNYYSASLVRNLRNKKTKRTKKSNASSTFEDKKIIIETHNKYRNNIALGLNKNYPKLPFAKNMIQMYYSEEIEAKAQAWADRNQFEHSSSAYRKQPDFHCGENVYTFSISGDRPKKDWSQAIKAWYEEIKDMEGKSVDSFADGGAVTGHFTQMIWAHSYIVGCGFSQYDDAGWIKQLYVCQYGPVGNIIGMPIYKSSKTKGCECDAGLTCGNFTYRGLCCEESKCKANVINWSGKLYKGTNPNNI